MGLQDEEGAVEGYIGSLIIVNNNKSTLSLFVTISISLFHPFPSLPLYLN